MNMSGAKLKRAAVQKTEHEQGNPFCAVHPDVASARPSSVQSDPEDAPRYFRESGNRGLRAHVRADHVAVARKRK